jgi:hypothetical protein
LVEGIQIYAKYGFMQHPRLNLGLLGFSLAAHAQLESYLAVHAAQAHDNPDGSHSPSHPVWQITDFGEANALLINTQHAHLDPHHVLRFHASANEAVAMGVQLSELTLPYAICGERSAQMGDVVAPHVPHIELADAHNVVRTLQHFEAALRPLRTVYALAHELMERRDELDRQHTYHLVRDGILDAIVDVPQRRLLVRSRMRPIDLQGTTWQPHPKSANSLPQGFTAWTLEDVGWIYAMHCNHLHLHNSYLHKPIYLRKMPSVGSAMLYPRHSLLLGVLGKGPATYVELAAALADQEVHLERDLYALFVCNAITLQSEAVAQSDTPPAAQPSGFVPSNRGKLPDFVQLETVPGQLS